MTRKRTTRASKVTNVKLPKVVVAEELAENDHQQQLSLHISEFKSKVKSILKDYEKRKRTMFLTFQRTTEAQIAQIPYELRHLTVKEFSAIGGNFEDALEFVRNKKSESVEDTLKRIDNLTWTALPMATVREEPHNFVGTQRIAPQTVKSKRTVKSRFMKTPAVTPKFDPCLKVTPDNIRDEHPGERLMSMAGTPVRRAFAENRKMLEDNLASAGLNVTPRTMRRLVDTVAHTVSRFGH